MKKLTINPLDPASIDRAIKYLEKYDKLVEKAADAYTEELANIGREAAYYAYHSNSTSLDVEKTDKGHKIVASGSQVVFLEFGTGAPTKTHELSAPVEAEIDISPGGWSRTEGTGKLAGWIEAGLDITTPPWSQYNMNPRPGMLEAFKAIQQGAKDAAKAAEKVFDDD